MGKQKFSFYTLLSPGSVVVHQRSFAKWRCECCDLILFPSLTAMEPVEEILESGTLSGGVLAVIILLVISAICGAIWFYFKKR